MQSPSVQRQVPDELVTESGDLHDVQAVLLDANHPGDAANDDALTLHGSEERPNPLWAVNGALAAFVFAALMYLASR